MPGALDLYQKGYTYRQKLARKDPTNLRRQVMSAMAAIPLADVLAAQERNLEALKLYRDAIATLDEAGPRYDRTLFDSYIKIGDILILQANPQGVLEGYNLASAIARGAAGKDPTNVAWEKNLERSFDRIGEFLVAQRRTPEAVEHYKKALEFVADVATQHPQIVAWPALARRLKEKAQSLTP